ncbi:hypothetical protein C723_2955 [Christiangramia flava JLT2011]|nr:hypothetical protein C723_2955 [Christiangramia flava JLT2011]
MCCYFGFCGKSIDFKRFRKNKLHKKALRWKGLFLMVY